MRLLFGRKYRPPLESGNLSGLINCTLPVAPVPSMSAKSFSTFRTACLRTSTPARRKISKFQADRTRKCGAEEPFLMPCPSAIDRLHLCETAIHKQFRARDVAAVIGCEKHHGPGDLIGCTEPAERNSVGNHLQALLAHPCGSHQVIQPGRVDGAWAHCVHPDAAIL